MAPIPKALLSFPLFKNMATETVLAVVHSGKRFELASAKLFGQGQKADKLFAVVTGKVKVTQLSAEGHQVLVRWAGPGSLVGGAPLFGAEVYPASADVISKASLISWDKKTVHRLLLQHPQLAVNTIYFLGQEMDQLRHRFHELATENVHRRIARALLRLVSQFGKREAEGVLIDFALSRQDLAEMTGTTLHTVSRILSAWQKQGLVRLGRKRVFILKPHELVSLADDLESP